MARSSGWSADLCPAVAICLLRGFGVQPAGPLRGGSFGSPGPRALTVSTCLHLFTPVHRTSSHHTSKSSFAGGPCSQAQAGYNPRAVTCCSVSLNKMPNVGNAPFLSSCNMKVLTAFTLGIFCENEGVQSHNMLAQCLLTVIV